MSIVLSWLKGNSGYLLGCHKYLSMYVTIQVKATTKRQSTRANMHAYKVLA